MINLEVPMFVTVGPEVFRLGELFSVFPVSVVLYCLFCQSHWI